MRIGILTICLSWLNLFRILGHSNSLWKSSATHFFHLRWAAFHRLVPLSRLNLKGSSSIVGGLDWGGTSWKNANQGWLLFPLQLYIALYCRWRNLACHLLKSRLKVAFSASLFRSSEWSFYVLWTTAPIWTFRFCPVDLASSCMVVMSSLTVGTPTTRNSPTPTVSSNQCPLSWAAVTGGESHWRGIGRSVRTLPCWRCLQVLWSAFHWLRLGGLFLGPRQSRLFGGLVTSGLRCWSSLFGILTSDQAISLLFSGTHQISLLTRGQIHGRS